MAISTNQKPTIYRNLYENTGPDISVEITRIYTWFNPLTAVPNLFSFSLNYYHIQDRLFKILKP